MAKISLAFSITLITCSLIASPGSLAQVAIQRSELITPRPFGYFIGDLIEHRLSYRWGNTNGRSRVIRPQKPHYGGGIVAVVDEGSASGGEWAAP